MHAPVLQPPPYAISLARDRSPKELAIQSEAALASLAGQFGVDVPTRELSGISGGNKTLASAALAQRTRVVITATPPFEAAPFIADLSQFLWAWNEKIEDRLHARGPGLLAAYDVGRLLAEVYWAQDPTATELADLKYLLGRERYESLRGLLVPLAGTLGPLTVAAVVGSFESWFKLLAVSLGPSREPLVASLEKQTLVWHSLVVDGVDPTSLLRHQDTGKTFSILAPLIGQFKGSLITSGSAFVLAVGGVIAAADVPGPRVWTAAIAALGLLGLGASGLYARARNRVEGVIGRVRDAYLQVVVTQAATKLPDGSSPKPAERFRALLSG